jgi:hypothetical protein
MTFRELEKRAKEEGISWLFDGAYKLTLENDLIIIKQNVIEREEYAKSLLMKWYEDTPDTDTISWVNFGFYRIEYLLIRALKHLLIEKKEVKE